LNITKIHTFGSSFTQGGGFEFHLRSSRLLNKIYKGVDSELSMENFSWPGQLQSILGNSIKIENHAKSGYGTDRMIRLVSNLVLDENFNVDTNLLLLEFTFLGRKEVFCNSINDFVVINYNPRDGINPSECISFARTYNIEETEWNSDSSILPSHSFFDKYITEFINVDNEINSMINESVSFLSMLDRLNVKYIIVQPAPYIPPRLVDYFDIKSKYVDFGDTNYMLEYATDDGKFGTIFHETNEMIDDFHFGFKSSKLVACKIHDNLVKMKYIDYPILNKTSDDFNYIDDIICNNLKSKYI